MPDHVHLLSAEVPAFQKILDLTGVPPVRTRPAGFETLLHIIMQQQLSLASAAAIWGRFKNYVNPLTPQTLLAADPVELRALGLSHAKIRYATALAEAITSKRLDLPALDRRYGPMPEADPSFGIDMLIAVKGIGRWTAEIYLLAAYDHPDIMPAADIALQVGAEAAFDLPERPRETALRELAADWQPWRSAAARLLWQYYRHLKGRETAL